MYIVLTIKEDSGVEVVPYTDYDSAEREYRFTVTEATTTGQMDSVKLFESNTGEMVGESRSGRTIAMGKSKLLKSYP